MTNLNSQVDYKSINQQALSQLLSQNPQAKLSNGKHSGIKCPKCGENEAFIDADDPSSLKCSRANNCGEETTLKEMFSQLYEKPVAQKKDKSIAREYLKSRALDPSKIDYWQAEKQCQAKGTETDLTFQAVAFNVAPKDEENNDKGLFGFRLIPHLDADGNLVEPKKRHSNSTKVNGRVYQTQSTLESVNEIWTCEGIFDAESLQQGLNKAAIATLSAENTPKEFYLEYKDKTFICAFNNDKAGKDATKKHIKFFKENSINYQVALPPKGKDWNDLLIEKILANECLEQSLQRGKEFELSLENKASENKVPIIKESQNTPIFDKRPESRFISEIVGKSLPNLACDKITNDWLIFEENYWQPASESQVKREVMLCLDKMLPNKDYSSHYVKDVTELLRFEKLTSNDWDSNDHLIPFINGVLDLNQKVLTPHAANNYFTWCLPYNYEATATCEPIIKFLFDCVGKNEDQVQLIRAYANAIIKGRYKLQKFLSLVGFGGTGKGTLLRLITSLVGEKNTVSTELKQLEQNRFETARLYKKKLILITDSDKYSGDVSVLKAATGQDKLRYELKGKQGNDGFTFKGMFLIAANQDIKSSDYTSGLARRRITIRFDNFVKENEVRDLQTEFEPFLSGFMNWVLEMPDNEVAFYIQETNKAVPSLYDVTRETLINTNPLAAWIDDQVVYEKNARSRIGNKGDNCNEFFYPNYTKFCDETGIKPMQLNNFSTNLIDLCKRQLGLIDVGKTEKTRTGVYITNLRLRLPNDNDELLSPIDIKFSGIQKQSEENKIANLIDYAKSKGVDISKNVAESFELNCNKINDGRSITELRDCLIDAFQNNGEKVAMQLIYDWIP